MNSNSNNLGFPKSKRWIAPRPRLLLSLAGLISILAMALISSQSSAALNSCQDQFDKRRQQPVFKRTESDASISTLYINGYVVWLNKIVTMNHNNYKVLAWDATPGQRTITVQHMRTGSISTVSPSHFANHKIAFRTVRLSDLLKFTDDRLLNRYMREYSVDRPEAERILKELMKWFFVDHRYTVEGLWPGGEFYKFDLGIYNEVHAIDQMWHEFILFTEGYREFGKKYLGYFEDHNPFDMPSQKTTAQKTADRIQMYRFIESTLGRNTLESWYGRFELSVPTKPIVFRVDIPPQE